MILSTALLSVTLAVWAKQAAACQYTPALGIRCYGNHVLDSMNSDDIGCVAGIENRGSCVASKCRDRCSANPDCRKYTAHGGAGCFLMGNEAQCGTFNADGWMSGYKEEENPSELVPPVYTGACQEILVTDTSGQPEGCKLACHLITATNQYNSLPCTGIEERDGMCHLFAVPIASEKVSRMTWTWTNGQSAQC